MQRLITMANKPDDDGLEEIETGVATRTRPRTKKPSNCIKVLMLNDDYTPMEFVVLVLQRFFGIGNRGCDARDAPGSSAGRRGLRGVHLVEAARQRSVK